MANLHSLYICCLVRGTPCVCSSAVDGTVLIIVVRERIFVSCSESASRMLLGVGGLSVLCCFLEPNDRIYRVRVQVLEPFLLVPSFERTVE